MKADADWNGLGDRGSLTVMRLLLLSLVLIALAGEEPIAPGWEKTGVTARDDVVLEIWRKPGDANGRVVLRNRTDSEVRVGYRVSAEISARVRPDEDAIVRLDTIPGVGRTVAEALVAEIGADLTRFPNAKHLAS